MTQASINGLLGRKTCAHIFAFLDNKRTLPEMHLLLFFFYFFFIYMREHLYNQTLAFKTALEITETTKMYVYNEQMKKLPKLFIIIIIIMIMSKLVIFLARFASHHGFFTKQ